MPRLPSELSPSFIVTREVREVRAKKATWTRGFVLGVAATFLIAYTIADLVASWLPLMLLR